MANGASSVVVSGNPFTGKKSGGKKGKYSWEVLLDGVKIHFCKTNAKHFKSQLGKMVDQLRLQGKLSKDGELFVTRCKPDLSECSDAELKAGAGGFAVYYGSEAGLQKIIAANEAAEKAAEAAKKAGGKK